MDHIEGFDIEKAKAHFKELNETIYPEGDLIIVNVATRYEVPVEECSSYEGILNWTLQLSEKTWMSRELLRHFMLVALRATKLDYPRG